MSTFDKKMNALQTEWRKCSIKSKLNGSQNGKVRNWILLPSLWRKGLWSGIRGRSASSLSYYLKQNSEIQKHLGVHNLKSSWMLCANLYFPFRATDEGRNLLADFLREHVDDSIRSVDGMELEYAEKGRLHPSPLLGEQGGGRGAGQTSPDIAFLVNDGKGLILTENKFVEHSFYPCSARKRTGSDKRPGNPDPSRCKDPLAILDNPVGLCHQVTWQRRYWDHLKPVIDQEKLASLKCCPASYAGYQLFRQQALAEGIAASGKYDLVVSCLAIDERNGTLQGCLKSTGISDVREWGSLFKGKAGFAVFTHQQWMDWIREHDTTATWKEWLCYVENRYGL